ncbi:acetate--CoA ligase [Cobetia crustatorum]|uniref:acetate--CoA ligase n=1 Tax=Cobetia crustatorum TaxID=553385 RepID=UPI0004680279|nr:acetate--CoA ligase [Cobetia crustatorum]
MLEDTTLASRERYMALVACANETPEDFWAKQARRINWFRQPQTILAWDTQQHARWYIDGEMNICHAALDHHVAEGRGDQVALYWDSPVTDSKRQYTYRELRDDVARLAGVLRGLGVEKGDRVIIYMPMVPEAMMAMLACARLGAVHSVVFGGFSPKELAVRIDDAAPKVIMAASCGVEIDRVIPYKPWLDEAIELAGHTPEACLVLQRDQQLATLGPRDHDWQACLQDAQATEAVSMLGSEPLYILYTSGTTGKPKGVVRDHAGYAVALHYSMEILYGVRPGDIFMAASDIGWVVGHSYIVYGPLLIGATAVMYEGKPVKTPDAGAFWRLIEEYRISCFFSAPTAFRAIKKEDPEASLIGGRDISSLRSLFLAGERLDPPTYHWLNDLLPVPIVDHWWQTETGWPVAGNLLGLDMLEDAQALPHAPVPARAGSATWPLPGFNVQILDGMGDQVAAGEQGNVVIQQPLPPGCLTGLYQDAARFQSAYLAAYPGYYLTGDGGYLDEDGYLFVMGRIDDVINVAGHRLSTGEMEQVLGAHPAIAECAVIGIEDSLKGEMPLGLVIIKDDWTGDEKVLRQMLRERVRDSIGAIASLKDVLIVERLPKTRSGKILRKMIRQIAAGEQYQVPSTIDDPSSLEDVREALSDAGIGRAEQARCANE